MNPQRHSAASTAAWAQSLAQGPIGDALLAVERAHTGAGTWSAAHTVLAQATRLPLIAGDHAALYLGAPAVGFALHTAAAGTDRYRQALATIDSAVEALTRRRLARAHARIDRGLRPRPAEFDLLYGLTGLGAYLLARRTRDATLLEVLAYLVRLTLPLPGDHDDRPGWWTDLAPPNAPPDHAPDGGHANLGMAHGVSGVLALLALSHHRGATTRGHTSALRRICTWLDAHQHTGPGGPWWPEWVTPAPQDETYEHPPRPSWCYGTPGIARAQQLAGLALRDTDRQRMAERAMGACLTDPRQLALLTDASLCHGTAGLYACAARVAADAPPGTVDTHLPRLHRLVCGQQPSNGGGLLEGGTGTALVTISSGVAPALPRAWDACLLLT
ncbi:lanthionine synthetase C family protein [Nocardiopsis trehalosi]|uniref:lanthionine synthetase C family protein n=1 Tax=Nocardiopsis trehalosi TaxID=109329 RepID=UPI000829E590|nr:lanthionine synthetase C family protein [Nocardiopsis trehalosi]